MSRENVKWIESVLLRKIISRDSNLENGYITNCSVRALETNKDNWGSMLYEVNFSVENHNAKRFSWLVKLEHDDKNIRKLMKSSQQFNNETHMYSVLLPSFLSQVDNENLKSQLDNLVPHCYYALMVKEREHESSRDGVVVLENLKQKGYKLGGRTSLDLQHCYLVMEKIGMFHAASYFSKEKKQNEFKKIIMPITEATFPVKDPHTTNIIYGVSEHRVIDALAPALPETDPGLVRLREIASRDAFNVYLNLVVPREPLAVLCHGDLLRNNVLFRYEENSPIDVKLIDFQMIRYASPAIDLSVFLCMNTSHETREAHFLRLLRTYHSSLRSTLASLLDVKEEQLPACYDFDPFMQDFRQHALYGYLYTIEFTPWMMATENEMEEFLHLYWTEIASPRYIEYAKKLGGERATNVMAELAKDLISYGCL